MISNPYQQYRAMNVQTASPVDLVVMLYQGVLRFSQKALDAIERKDVREAHESLVRVQDIIAELTGSLNMDDGGEVARGLVTVYDYAYRQLVQANCRKDPAPVREVIGIFRELASAWQQIAQTQRKGAAATQPVPGMAAPMPRPIPQLAGVGVAV